MSWLAWAAGFAAAMVVINVVAILVAAKHAERLELHELRGPLVFFNLCGAIVLASLLWSLV